MLKVSLCRSRLSRSSYSFALVLVDSSLSSHLYLCKYTRVVELNFRLWAGSIAWRLLMVMYPNRRMGKLALKGSFKGSSLNWNVFIQQYLLVIMRAKTITNITGLEKDRLIALAQPRLCWRDAYSHFKILWSKQKNKKHNVSLSIRNNPSRTITVFFIDWKRITWMVRNCWRISW